MNMASLCKHITFIRGQQIRFLPRFSPAWPEKPLESTNALGSQMQETHETTSEDPKYSSTRHKINWKLPKSLVINSAQKKPDQSKGKSASMTQKLKAISEEYTIDEEGNLIYTKMQDHDVRITKIMAGVKTRNKKNEFMLLEGKRLIKEALLTQCKLEYILFSRLKDVEDLQMHLPKKGGKLYKMPYKEMQVWSDLTTNPGIMGIFKIPPSDFFKPKNPLPLTVICDNVREPNNLGAILRTASGAGCEQVVLTKGCVNVWESKVLRTACGAHFRVKMSSEANWDDIRKTMLPKDANVFVADNNILSLRDECESATTIIESLVTNVPVLPYFSADFKLSNHIVLIIGGETEGLSVDSYKLANEFNGVRLNVPLSNGVESLNTGTALGIIAFEIKRQLTNRVGENEKVKC